jgi:uncharacterized membrane protein
MLIEKLIEGLTDAVGFVVGALAVYGLGENVGLDLIADGYSTSSIVGIVLIGLGGGLGLQAARHLRGKIDYAHDSTP